MTQSDHYSDSPYSAEEDGWQIFATLQQHSGGRLTIERVEMNFVQGQPNVMYGSIHDVSFSNRDEAKSYLLAFARREAVTREEASPSHR